jgi:hypothetical protein
LPADAASQAKMAADDGFILPIHDSSHPNYDVVVRGEILMKKAKYGNGTPTPVEARAIFEEVAKEMELQIRSGRWMPKLR